MKIACIALCAALLPVTLFAQKAEEQARMLKPKIGKGNYSLNEKDQFRIDRPCIVFEGSYDTPMYQRSYIGIGFKTRELAGKSQFGYYGPDGSKSPYWETDVRYFLDPNADVVVEKRVYSYYTRYTSTLKDSQGCLQTSWLRINDEAAIIGWSVDCNDGTEVKEESVSCRHMR